MNFSYLSELCSIVGGIALGVTWLWKLQQWFRSKLTAARSDSQIGGKLVTELLKQATSPARRADIHAYILFRCSEIECNRITIIVRSFSLAIITIIFSVILAFAKFAFEITSIPFIWWLSVGCFIILIVSFSIVIFYSHLLLTFESGWQKNVANALSERAFKHLV